MADDDKLAWVGSILMALAAPLGAAIFIVMLSVIFIGMVSWPEAFAIGLGLALLTYAPLYLILRSGPSPRPDTIRATLRLGGWLAVALPGMPAALLGAPLTIIYSGYAEDAGSTTTSEEPVDVVPGAPSRRRRGRLRRLEDGADLCAVAEEGPRARRRPRFRAERLAPTVPASERRQRVERAPARSQLGGATARRP